jgi:hypothetical protein
MQVADSPPVARAVLSGETGEAVVTLLFDEAGKITDIELTDWPLVLGIGNIQIDCPAGSVPQIAKLYAELLGRAASAGARAELGGDRQPDPEYPQQMHMGIKFEDYYGSLRLAERLGAIRLPNPGGHATVYADPAGHPFCLCFPGQ